MVKAGVMECPEFNLGMTLESGQTFHWMQVNDLGGASWSGCIGSIAITLRQEGRLLHYRGGSPDLLSRYFAFDHDLEEVRLSCAAHPASFKASQACRGLRVMRQPLWECLASFILSPMKQVAHIRQMSLALRSRFGQPLKGTSVPAFPEARTLAEAGEKELRKCGLGFRAKSLQATAQLVASGEFHPEALRGLSTEAARIELCRLPGIGRKVANCILLFAYERLEAIPVDVWVARILGSFRSQGSRKMTLDQLERYGERLLGPYAGYIQQYLFHQARTGELVLPKQRAPRKKPALAKAITSHRGRKRGSVIS